LLLTSSFWAPFTLWASTSLFIPLLVSYFFNLTLKPKPLHATRAHTAPEPTYKFDPLVFNVVKALITYAVYAQGFRFGGFVENSTVERIGGAVTGGYEGILIGAGIGALASIYEAILKK
jgi:hypothetical protein